MLEKNWLAVWQETKLKLEAAGEPPDIIERQKGAFIRVLSALDQLPQKASRPIRANLALLYTNALTIGVDMISPELSRQYADATVKFPYRDVCKLSPDAFLVVQQRLKDSVTHIDQVQAPFSPTTLKLLEVGAPHNILLHEKEHLDVPIWSVRDSGEIHITVVGRAQEPLALQGFVDTSNYSPPLSLFERALMFTNPTVLPLNDILCVRGYLNTYRRSVGEYDPTEDGNPTILTLDEIEEANHRLGGISVYGFFEARISRRTRLEKALQP